MLIITKEYIYLHIINSQTQKINAMTKEEIIKFIKDEEKLLYLEFTELRKMYGREHESTRFASAQWNAVLGILENIEIIENNDNI